MDIGIYCPQCLPLSYWRRTHGNQRDDVQLSGRSAVHGSGRDHQLPTAFSQRRAGELHVQATGTPGRIATVWWERKDGWKWIRLPTIAVSA